jgi:hypothetical protein
MREATADVSRRFVGAEQGPVRFVDCWATTRTGRNAALKGCRERLAAIRYEPGGVLVFEVRAPVHVDAGVIVLERPADLSHPVTVIRPRGVRVAFRCAGCGGLTNLNVKALAKLGTT